MHVIHNYSIDATIIILLIGTDTAPVARHGPHVPHSCWTPEQCFAVSVPGRSDERVCPEEDLVHDTLSPLPLQELEACVGRGDEGVHCCYSQHGDHTAE